MAEVGELTFEWVDWYNNQRDPNALGSNTPEEFELAYNFEINAPSTGAATPKTIV